MKRFLLGLFTIIDVCLITIFINLYGDYSDNKNSLLSKLNGSSYIDVINDMESDRNKIVKEISDITKYEINNYNDFEKVYKELNSEYDELVLENNKLINKKEQLTKQDNNLRIVYNKILEEERKKSTFMISNVPKINQYSMGYPTGCESAALTNLLNYYGVSVSMSSVIFVLPKGSLPYYEGNIKYGGNPYVEFVGTPSSYSSYGVYEKPIVKVANHFKSGVIDGTGMSLNSVLNVVKENRPVIVWVSMNMAVPYISTSWIYKPTGEKISWMANEHALLVVGYNQNQVIVSDSLNGGIRYYDKGVFESRYNTYGKRAVYY